MEVGSGLIEEISLAKFCAGNSYDIVPHDDRKYSRKESVCRARKRLSEDTYSVTGNNCEHFVNWCIEGDHKSTQVDIGTTVGSSGLSTATGIVK